MTISEKISLYRKKSGWSQEEFAEKISVSRQAVSKWETGEAMPEITKLALIAKVFGVSADFLIDDEQESYTPPRNEVRHSFIDKETADKAASFLRKYGWLSGVLLIIIGATRLVSTAAALVSFLSIGAVNVKSFIMPCLISSLTGLVLVAAGIVIIVKFKPKKQ